MHRPFSIINFTPDSFSDGGDLFSVGKVIDRVRYLKSIGITCFDIGAQSTAPKNDDVGVKVEKERLGLLFNDPTFVNLLSGLTLSIDTFRWDCIFEVYSKIKNSKVSQVIWNDVSGVMDEDVERWLKLDSRNSYVLCHNLCGSRDKVCDHIDYINNDLKDRELIEHIVNFFKERLSVLDITLHPRVLLDVCFGFSKSYEQNIYLIKNHKRIEEFFSNVTAWVFGVSRKSFLRKSVQLEGGLAGVSYKDERLLSSLVALELCAMRHGCSDVGNYFIRTHLPEIYISMEDFTEKLNTYI